ncbi:MAG: zinc ribbon domain-containing protein [Lachnospiraceae bacterium]|nr:zinc ribbon domain-containing protein [Lachnospiraceae bacterium]
MYCEKCGARIPDDSKFCEHCGSPVNPAPRSERDDSPKRQPASAYSAGSRKEKPLIVKVLKFLLGAAVVCALLFGAFLFFVHMLYRTPPEPPLYFNESGSSASDAESGSASDESAAGSLAESSVSVSQGLTSEREAEESGTAAASVSDAQGGAASESSGGDAQGTSAGIPPGGVMHGAASLGMTEEEIRKAEAEYEGQTGTTPSPDSAGLPEEADFLWYLQGNYGLDTRQGNNWSVIPDEALMLSDPSALAGDWKTLVLYEDAETYEPTSCQFFNSNLAYDAGRVTVTFKWYKRYYFASGELVDEQDKADYVCSGSWNEQGLAAEDKCGLIVTAFYELDGRQYALGSVESGSGRRCQLAMVRP